MCSVECGYRNDYNEITISMIDFARLIRRFRLSKDLSQNELVDLIAQRDNRLAGIDVVTISRWENAVVKPCHRRQVDVFQALSKPYFEHIQDNKDLLIKPFVAKKIKNANVWDVNENLPLSQVKYRRIRSTDSRGNSIYCIVYSDSRGVPVAQVSYKYMPTSHFWKEVVHRKPKTKVDLNPLDLRGELCIQITSMFCSSENILPHIFGIMARKLLTKEVDIVGFSSSNRRANLKNLLKTIGFKTHSEGDGSLSLILDYYDALYNKELFYSAIMVGVKGDINAEEN